MKYKVVIFDLFETLVTEWGHKKYTKNEMCADMGIEASAVSNIINKRIVTKAGCFESINPNVFQLLSKLRDMGLRMAIISNCSSEEVNVLKESPLYRYFDEVLLFTKYI